MASKLAATTMERIAPTGRRQILSLTECRRFSSSTPTGAASDAIFEAQRQGPWLQRLVVHPKLRNDEKGKFDEMVEDKGVKILVDPKALMHVVGTKMDFIYDKLSSEFIFINPNSKGQCGCGESFMTKPREQNPRVIGHLDFRVNMRCSEMFSIFGLTSEEQAYELKIDMCSVLLKQNGKSKLQ